jgi:hypothetical protein
MQAISAAQATLTLDMPLQANPTVQTVAGGPKQVRHTLL